MNRVQELQFELMKEASFNSFDGAAIVESLSEHEELWRGVVMTRLGCLICLRDIEDNCWNVDTLFILPREGREDELMTLARSWNADETDWVGGKEACSLLGSFSRNLEQQQKSILRVWWD